MDLIKNKTFDLESKDYSSLYKKWESLFKDNKIAIVPTDTIYGISSLINKQTVKKISEIKKRAPGKSYSILAPNIKWIIENFKVSNNFENILKDSLEKYHGITFLLERKNINYLDYVSQNEKIGVRLIKHPLQDFANYIGEPLITTSANISSKPNPVIYSNIDDELNINVDFIIKDDSKVFGKPSTLLNSDGTIFLKRD